MPGMGNSAEKNLARLADPRLARELKTIRAMLRIACRDRHGTADGLCADCESLADYAAKRLALCPYGADKPTCVNCRIHCYGPRQREQVRDMMRHAGPRMMLRHPVLAVMHVVDGRRPAPPKPNEALAAAAASQRETAKPGAAAADAGTWPGDRASRN
jgi:hypothetical protein